MAADADEVISLPGWDDALPSRHFSGYLSASDTKHLHYYFVQSENNPATDPVVFWFNGGPGCSSLDGFFYEHGPFRIDPQNFTQLVRFENTWAKLANMVYIEAPVGVGFSYSDDPEKDYKCNDDTSSQDNLHAVESFFAKFPSFKNHDMFITGESYAGVYVPTLAEAIVWAMGNGTYTGSAPLKAIAVGNGCTGTEIGVCGPDRDFFTAEYLMSTGFIPQASKEQLAANCDFTLPPKPLSKECLGVFDNLQKVVGPLNLYNVYGECIHGLPPSSDEEDASSSSSKTFHKAPLHSQLGLSACLDSIAASAYVNRPEVIKAMHVKPIDFTWATCASAKGWSYDSTRPNLPRDTYPLLLEHMRVVIYNGDWDACVPYTDNEAWTSSMGLNTAKPWHSWTYKNGTQIGGYATVYEGNLTFTTVRGGRHEVPETAPEKAFELLRRLISSEAF
eukprot:jgi/Bigna1/39639/e_gw1.34.17.1